MHGLDCLTLMPPSIVNDVVYISLGVNISLLLICVVTV